MKRLIFTVILLWLLTACGARSMEPSSKLVQQALALQLSQIQQQLSQPLQLSTPRSFEVKRAVITEKQPFDISNLPAYRVRGTYDVIIQLAGRRVSQQHNPFEIYLQRQKEGKTWRLALPKSSNKDANSEWYTYLIQ